MFGFFDKKPAKPAPHITPPQSTTPSLPTVKAAPELFATFEITLKRELATIKGLSRGKINEIYRFISNGDGGFLNQGRWHQAVFETYFQGRSWTWPEFNHWNKIFTEMGDHPVRWPDHALGIEEAIGDKWLYVLLMRTIDFRAKSIHSLQRYAKLGAGWKLMLTHPEDQKFIDLALAKNPNATPPFWPDDITLTKVVIPGISD